MTLEDEIRVTLMWSANSTDTRSQDGQRLDANIREAYQVTHPPDTSLAAILQHKDIPQEKDLFIDARNTQAARGLPGIFCRSRNRTMSSPIYSVITCNYSGEYGPDGIEEHPLAKEPEIERSNTLVTLPTDTDFNGNPITNSIGEPVDGITTEISDFNLVVKRNFRSVNVFAIRQYLRSHNSDFFDGWPPGTARFRSYRARELRYEGKPYYEVTARIEFREPYNTVPAHAWYARYRNEGMHEIVGPIVTIASDGSGSGALAYPITSGGRITKIVVSNRGQGYETPPAVTISDPSGDGTGATAEATLVNDRVSSIQVTNQGEDYYASFVHAVDRSGKEVSRPVLLDVSGKRLEDANQAVWIERPLSGGLPYEDLGLL